MKVFILGSGFSAAAGLPTSKQILKAIFSSNDTAINEVYAWLSEHLFANTPDWCDSVNIEEVISRLDLFRLYTRDTARLKKIAQVEQQILAQFIELLQPANYQLAKEYISFVRQLSPKDTIITFNYDLILEESFMKSATEYYYPWHLEQTLAKQKLLKLHGSLNMYFCTACNYIHFFHTDITQHPQTLRLQGRPLQCGKCGQDKLEQMIVAPTLFKSYTLSLLEIWWYQAFKALSQAQEIFFIGYSLPPADLLSRQLFNWSYNENKELRQVWLINGPRNQGIDLRAIYGELLTNTHLTFAQWCQDQR